MTEEKAKKKSIKEEGAEFKGKDGKKILLSPETSLGRSWTDFGPMWG